MPSASSVSAGVQVADTPAHTHCVEWHVELEVEGYIWVHDWYGYARDSQHAVKRARLDFYGGLYGDKATMERYALKVRSVMQVGV